MPRHPPRHRMDGEAHLRTTRFQSVGQLLYGLLRLREGHSIAGYNNHIFGLPEDFRRRFFFTSRLP